MPLLILIEVSVRTQTREEDILDSVDVDVAQVVVDLRPGSVKILIQIRLLNMLTKVNSVEF